MKPLYAIFAALAATSIVAIAADSLAPLPPAWIVTGPTPEQYKAGIDPHQSVTGKGAKYLGSVDTSGKSWGALTQVFGAEKYRGQRIRLQARVKTADISNWAGLWMRVDATTGKSTAFYNSRDKPIKGSTDWTLRSVVLDVAPDASGIAFGVIANGSGQVWIDDIKIDPVPTTVPVDHFVSQPLPSAPVL